MLKRFYPISILILVCILLPTNVFAIGAECSITMTPLFEKSTGNYYNYAPCLIQTDNTTKYVYYCSNINSSEIVEYICWRKGQYSNGVWTWGPENMAFGPSQSEWDQCHVCDPDIIKGKFNYNGHTYTWAMTYLGVAQWDCNANQIGIAFSDSIEGPWVKFNQNPIIFASNTTSWGVGQDSMVSLDNNGKFRIVYRDSDGNDDYCRYKDFDFTNAEQYTETEEKTVTRNGLTDGISHTCSSHVAYDPIREVYYMAAEHVWDEQRRSCRETLIAVLGKNDFENGTGAWDIIYQYNQGNTGYVSNHNASIGRDSYGRIVNSNTLNVAMSSSDDSGLWSFKINEGYLNLSDLDTSTSFITGHVYQLKNKATGLVLDNWNSENGTSCYSYEWTGVYNQEWVVTNLGGNNYKLLNRWTNKVLDNFENNNPEGVYVWDDVSGVDQHWEITSGGGGYYKIINLKTGRAITSTSSTNGSPVIATNYQGNDEQLWEFIDMGLAATLAQTIESGKTYRLVNKSTGDVLDNWNSENGAVCYSYIWTGVNNQKWVISTINQDGYFKIINKWTNNALDCFDVINSAPVYTWNYVAGEDQHWSIIPVENGYFKIINQKTGKALTQSIQGNGSSMFCWDYIGNDTQLWAFICTTEE